jgi:hypothetical protein
VKTAFKSALVAATLGLVFYAAPSMAHGNGHGHHWGKGHGSAKGAVQTNSGRNNPSSAPDADDTSGSDTDVASQSGSSQSNPGRTVRGLERANDVGGEHGEWGRTIAGKHGRR